MVEQFIMFALEEGKKQERDNFAEHILRFDKNIKQAKAELLREIESFIQEARGLDGKLNTDVTYYVLTWKEFQTIKKKHLEGKEK